MKKLSHHIFFIIIVTSCLSFNCHKEVVKDNETHSPELVKPDTIPPGHAQITGKIILIEPTLSTADSSDPCSKVPCIAKVKVESIEYGAGFSVLNNKEIRIKFEFTLSPTTKDLFPNMNESYPGLKVGDEFSALTGFQASINDADPKFMVYGYSIIKN
jgi:hypothetical protein